MTFQVNPHLPDGACDRCGYDLRAQPTDGKCPECGASVAESIRLAAIPRRPAWRDSDPRWRRRILAGVWLLVLLPGMDLLLVTGWAERISLPAVLEVHSATRTLDQSLVAQFDVFAPLLFCMGTILLFAHERNRRRNRWDRTCRWGILCSYVSLLINAAEFCFIAALVTMGVAAVFLGMPLKYQPGSTLGLGKVGFAVLAFGPQPGHVAELVAVAASAAAILLACGPLWNALRSCGWKWLAALLLAPLLFFAVIYLVMTAFYAMASYFIFSPAMDSYWTYFVPQELVRPLLRGNGGNLSWNFFVGTPSAAVFTRELIKWLSVAIIAIRLTVAQILTWHRQPGQHAASFARSATEAIIS